jgi:hypothetical protein
MPRRSRRPPITRSAWLRLFFLAPIVIGFALAMLVATNRRARLKAAGRELPPVPGRWKRHLETWVLIGVATLILWTAFRDLLRGPAEYQFLFVLVCMLAGYMIHAAQEALHDPRRDLRDLSRKVREGPDHDG